MNEPSNLVDGSLTGCPSSSLEEPPYIPAVVGGKLYSKTLCMSAKHYKGLHYDVHNLYGMSEAVVTNLWVNFIYNSFLIFIEIKFKINLIFFTGVLNEMYYIL